MKTIKIFVAAVFAILLHACSVSPEPINYGKDQCDFCKMGIVDQSHGAQYVTQKGKQFKFDAIECLMREISNPEMDSASLRYVLVSDYNNPGSVISAKEASYIICKKIKSPMGAYLSAFGSDKEAQKVIDELGGDPYTWETIQAKFKKK